MELFLNQMMATSTKICQSLKKIIPMEKPTLQEWCEIHSVDDCRICWKRFIGNSFFIIIIWFKTGQSRDCIGNIKVIKV